MKVMKKYSAVFFLVVAILGCLGKEAAAAEAQNQEVNIKEVVQVDMEKYPTNEELFAGYAEKVLYSDLYEDSSVYANTGENRLKTEESKEIYKGLKKKIEEVAAGDLESTEILLEKVVTWTASDLGVSRITAANVGTLVGKKIAETVDLASIIDYLLMDCPYDFYWYDKTNGIGEDSSYRYEYSSKSASLSIFLQMPVEEEYQKDSGEIYQIDTSKAKSLISVKNNAQRIVNDSAGKSDYEKMRTYKNKICDLTAYNYDAADSSKKFAYGNPWQLIWVFDEDANTKVVCEGYAKAFQYLCDLSGLNCYTVTGTLTAGTGAGLHMWNVVTLDGQNYLVDVTNCDVGTIGYSDKLFLAGTDFGNVTDGYTFKLGYEVSFIYDDEQILLLGEELLSLAAENYSVKEPETTTPVTDIFDDVSDTDWFADEVQYVYDKGIMTGVSDTIFEPGTAVTRATIVQTLYKLEGKPEVSDFTKYNSLNDTPDNIWWKNGLAWALNEGVAKGDSKKQVFNPDNEVTREDLATFIYRYAQYKGVNVELEGTVEGILGDTFVNSWAKTAFAWAIESGLIKGKTINGVADLAPQVGATRSELATIIMRFYENNNLNDYDN